MRAALALLLALAATGCVGRPAPAPTPARYVVGGGYQAGGTWFYPRESFRYDATGLASVLPDRAGLTANGERRDPTAMAAAHQTLQLPAIVIVTNLETGAQARVRVNDRGPDSPARLIALAPRAASLLGIAGVGRVRVQADEAASLALRDQLGGGPRLAVAAAPRDSVQAEALAPPPGVAQSARLRGGAGPVAATNEVRSEAARVPDRLPETVTRGPAAPGQLMIEAGSFGQLRYARQLEAKLAAIGARVRREPDGRQSVAAGPFANVAAADSALDRAMRAGVSDARIVVQ